MLLATTSCKPEPVGGPVQVTPPEGVLAREAFIQVLAEVQLVEGAAEQRLYRNDNERQKLAEAYNDVWHRTGISAEEFEASHEWWWSHPEAMKGVLRDVVDVLKEMEVASNRADEKRGSMMDGNLKNRTPGGTPAPSSK